MKLKQRLAELLPHFDDDGKLLPNKVMTVKQNPLGGFRASTLCDFERVVANVMSGNEYRIEDAPKRPREVWFTPDMKLYQAFKPSGAIGIECIRFIEDTLREVTDGEAIAAYDVYNDSIRAGDHPAIAVRKAIQDYEKGHHE